MRSSRVDELGDRVLTALHAGVGVAEAAASVGLAEQTVRSWVRRGREVPTGRFAPFAAAVDGRGRVTIDEPRVSGEVDEATLVASILDAAQRGQWRAAAWLLERGYPERQRRVGEPDSGDPFAALDELAARRRGDRPGS
jgi:hypothetical protein